MKSYNKIMLTVYLILTAILTYWTLGIGGEW